MKIKITFLLAFALLINFGAFAQFFDSVPYIGALGVYGGTRGVATGFKGYDPDPSNTDANWTTGWTEFAPNTVAYPGDAGYNQTNLKFYTKGTAAEKVVISGDISADYTMTNDKWYVLSGLIHVLSGATLTIQPGTCIRGDVSNLGGLIITKGAKINAVSDRAHPVVLTSGKAVGSRVRGDWAGLLIIGNASCNVPNGHRRYEALPSDPLSDYGGNNDADNSGSIRYMRVEFAGYNYLPDQEINGITFAGVGNGSHFDYMQSAFANDDDFEWFGGTCNHKYLVGFAGTDDVFDMDEGYSGKCQYLLGVRHAGVTETSPAGACNGLEHDNNTNLGTPSAVNPNITAPTPTTTPTISNMTLVGPEHPGAVKSSLSTLWQQRTGEAFRLRTNEATGVFNSITWGWPTMINLPNVGNLSPSTQTRAADDELSIRNTVVITSNGDVRFNSSNFPTGGWAAGVTPWTGLGQMRNWIINGPQVSVYNFTGATMNDTTRSTILDLGTSSSDMTNPDYIGLSNGAISQLDYSQIDLTLKAASAFRNASSFQHPRIALVAQPSVALDNTSFPNFTQTVGTPSASKRIIIKTNALKGNVAISVPSGFEVSANGTSGWSAGYTKGSTAADTLIFVRLNRTAGGSSNGFMMISSSNSEFNTINIALNGTAVAPATPYFNVSASTLNFNNLAGAASVQSFVVSGKNLTSGITFTANSVFQVSSDNVTFGSTATLSPVAGTVATTKVWVKYNPTVNGTDTGSLYVTATGADKVTVSLNGNSKPIINVTPGAVLAGGATQIQYPVFNITAGVASLALPINISASQLTDTVKVNFPANFEVSVDSAFTSPVVYPNTLFLNVAKAATLNQKIYVRYNATTATTNAGFLTVATTGSPITFSGGTSSSITGPYPQVVSLSGRAVAAASKFVQIWAPTYQLKFSSVINIPTAPQVMYVAGSYLGTDSVVVTAPANWDISLNGTTYTNMIYLPNTGGFVAPTPILVRYNPTIPIALNQFVIVNVSSAGAGLPNTNSATNLVELVFGIATPALFVDQPSLPTFYTTVGKPSYANTLMLNGNSLTNNVVVNSSNGFEVSADSITFSTSLTLNQVSGNLAATKLFIRYNGGSTPGFFSGNYVNISSVNAAAIPFYVSAVAVLPALPTLNLSTASIALNIPGATSTSPASALTVNAANLVDSLTIGTATSFFTLTNDTTNATSWKQSWKIAGDANGSISNLKLYVRYKNTVVGTNNDSITFTSTGLTTQKVALVGSKAVGFNEMSAPLSAIRMYPNPANTSLNVAFSMNRAGAVSINIFDLTGKLIKEVASNEHYFAGVNETEINVSDLKNGVYFVQVTLDGASKTERLLIAR